MIMCSSVVRYIGQRSLAIIFVVHKIHDFYKFSKNAKIELLENLELYGIMHACNNNNNALWLLLLKWRATRITNSKAVYITNSYIPVNLQIFAIHISAFHF